MLGSSSAFKQDLLYINVPVATLLSLEIKYKRLNYAVLFNFRDFFQTKDNQNMIIMQYPFSGKTLFFIF